MQAHTNLKAKLFPDNKRDSLDDSAAGCSDI